MQQDIEHHINTTQVSKTAPAAGTGEVPKTLSESANELAEQVQALSEKAANLAAEAADVVQSTSGQPFLVTGITIFVLACFVGYHVVWRVTPALHSPLMGITNAISSVIIVGAIVSAGTGSFFGFLAVVLASVNIFGGFIITRRMLHMFKKKEG